MTPGYEPHASVFERRRLQRNPDAHRTVSVSRIPVRFVLVPRRGTTDSRRFQDGVIAERPAFGAQQLPSDFVRIAVGRTFDQPRRIALRVDDLRQRRASHVRIQFDTVTGFETAVALEELVVQAEQRCDFVRVREGFEAEETVASHRAEIERAAREFDGWVGSGARSSWQKVTDGIARFRSLGGKRAILTNVLVRLDSPTASPEGPDDPFDLACPPAIARQRLARIQSLGYDDIVLVSRRHDEEHLRQLRGLL